MSTDKVEFVIVPGSFATPPPYDVLVKSFAAQGYAARVVGLLSANDGTRLPPATMEEDAAEIRKAVLSILDDPKQPKNVVLAVHSYAGFPGTEAAKGLSKAERSAQGKDTAVIGLVYLAAFIPQKGQATRDIMAHVDEFPPAFKIPAPGTYYPETPAEFAQYVWNDVEDPAEVARLHATFTRHSADSYDGKLSYESWRDIPALQFLPTKDFVIPVHAQEELFEYAKSNAPKFTQVRIENGGHCFCLHGAGIDRTTTEIIKFVQANV